jgi:diacylglycerol kinase (ATP)
MAQRTLSSYLPTRLKFLLNRGYWYLALTLVILLVFWLIPNWPARIFIGWCAASFAYVSAAYLLLNNRMLFKSAGGVLPRPVKWLLFPFLISATLYNRYARSRDPVEPLHEIRPGLFLGRRLFSSDLPLLQQHAIDAILDTTVEFDALDRSAVNTPIAYLNVPIFDHGVPHIEQLHRAVLWVDQRRRQRRRVVIHCALGRGRSATILLAYLLFAERDKTVRELLMDVQTLRATVSPNYHQLRVLEKYWHSTLIHQKFSAALIVNPTAGKGAKKEVVKTLLQHLQPFLYLEVFYVSKKNAPDVLARRALESGRELLIAAGGDGTVSAVAAELIGRQAILGIIPLGTANALATCLYGVGVQVESLQTSCARIVAGITQTIDTAECNGRPMTLLAGLGYECQMVVNAEQLKSQWGALAYLAGAAQGLQTQRAFDVRMTVDGLAYEFSTPCLVVANGAPVTSLFARGHGEPRLDDAALDITWLEPDKTTTPVAQIALLLQAALTGGAKDNDGIAHKRGKEIEILTSPVVAAVIDGEVCEKTPLRINVKPSSLRVIADAAANQPTADKKSEAS